MNDEQRKEVEEAAALIRLFRMNHEAEAAWQMIMALSDVIEKEHEKIEEILEEEYEEDNEEEGPDEDEEDDS